MSRGQKVIVIGLGALLGLWFLLAGSQKFFAREAFEDLFNELGLAARWVPVIGAVELIAAVLVMVPRTAIYGAALIAAVMVGAITCHLFSGAGSPVAALVALLMSLVLASVRLRSRAVAARAT